MEYRRFELLLPEELVNRDIHYNSVIWDEYLVSEVLVVPTAASGKGIVALREIAESGMKSARDSRERTSGYSLGIINDRKYLIMVNEFLARLTVEGSAEALAANHEALVNLQQQLNFYLEYIDKTKKLHDQFELISRLSTQTRNIQLEFKYDLLKNPLGIAKLAIAMKCIDAAWGCMRIAWKEMELLTPIASNPHDYITADWVEFEIRNCIITVYRDRKEGPKVERIMKDNVEQDDEDDENTSGDDTVDDDTLDENDEDEDEEDRGRTLHRQNRQ